MGEKQLYICTRIVEAEAMNGSEAIHNGLKAYPGMPGYVVRHPDGYESWSPQNVFEHAYRMVSKEELAIILKNNLRER